jgi:hypothetical protein
MAANFVQVFCPKTLGLSPIAEALRAHEKSQAEAVAV